MRKRAGGTRVAHSDRFIKRPPDRIEACRLQRWNLRDYLLAAVGAGLRYYPRQWLLSSGP